MRVESNKKAILFSALFLSGDVSSMFGISGCNIIDVEDGLDTNSTLVISNFLTIDHDKWVEIFLGFFFCAIFNRQNKETAIFTDSKSISNTVANY